MAGMDAELGVKSGADCSLLEATVGDARMSGGYRADSDRLMAHTLMAAAMAVCSRSPSWAELSVDGVGDGQRDVRTNASQIHFQLAWGPGSGQWGSQGADGWTEAETDSRQGSWSGQLEAGVGDEEAGGRGVA